MNYQEITDELKSMLEPTWFTNLATASAILMDRLPDINWVGFYMMEPSGELVLGPFQGKPACLRIGVGKGVCGTAALMRESVLVEDVHKFPGHIACDARSQSEVVVPLIVEGRVVGVLDVDSPSIGRFSSDDQRGLEKFVEVLVSGTTWPKEIQ